jgi:hypothetical protein
VEDSGRALGLDIDSDGQRDADIARIGPTASRPAMSRPKSLQVKGTGAGSVRAMRRERCRRIDTAVERLTVTAEISTMRARGRAERDR